MNKESKKKLGFFKKLGLAITDFRFYPLILKIESLGKAIGHFLLLIALLMFILSVIMFKNAFGGIDSFLLKYDEVIPEFELNDGVLNIENEEFYKLANNLVLTIDTDYKYDEIIHTDKYKKNTLYDSRIYITSDAVTYEYETGYQDENGNEEVGAMQFVLSNVLQDYNKDEFYDAIVLLKSNPMVRVYIFIAIYFAMFLGFTFNKIFEIILFSIATSLLARIMGIKVAYKNYIKLVLYALTLPCILETISYAYSGYLSEGIYLIIFSIIYVYILYAIRAVKLDAVILIMNNSKVVKKAKNGNTIISIENELHDKNEENKTSNDEKKEDNSNEDKTDDDNTQN